MLNRSLNEYQRAGSHGLYLVTRPERRLSAEDVVNFILGVRSLLVSLPCFEEIDAHAERRNSQEFQPGSAALVMLRQKAGQIEDLHVTSFAYVSKDRRCLFVMLAILPAGRLSLPAFDLVSEPRGGK